MLRRATSAVWYCDLAVSAAASVARYAFSCVSIWACVMAVPLMVNELLAGMSFNTPASMPVNSFTSCVASTPLDCVAIVPMVHLLGLDGCYFGWPSGLDCD